jgi:hypothetical protein
MLIAEAVGEAGAPGIGVGRGMPGEMPGHEVLEFLEDAGGDGAAVVPARVMEADRGDIDEEREEGDEYEEDEEEEEEVAVGRKKSLHLLLDSEIFFFLVGGFQPLPLRILRGVMNRIWGVRRDESSSEDEDGNGGGAVDDGDVD